MEAARNVPEFITITCVDWKRVLEEDRFKRVITDSLAFLVARRRIWVYAFVIMPNHLHMIWQIREGHKRPNVQRDFLKHVSQTILTCLREEKSLLEKELKVWAADRQHQIWKKNSVSIPLWSLSLFFQKLNYIHKNPVRARLCKLPEDYTFSSASYYDSGIKEWQFLTHYEEYREA